MTTLQDPTTSAPARKERSLDWIVSVDDHVIEPPNVWVDRLPKKYRDIGPRLVETERGAVWLFEDKEIATSGLSVAAGKRRDEFTPEPLPFSEMRPAAYDPVARLVDMDRAGILASLCFPSFPRFCGQLFYEASDKELGLLCVKAYNDWMIDEWCGSAPGRYIPLIIIPLGDPAQAAREIERCAARGTHAVAFSENPEPLGLPTIFNPSHYWDPVFKAAEETESVLCMHVGSSSQMVSACSDAPELVNLALGASRTAAAMLSWLFSDTFDRMPGLKIALSEGNIGWIPYFLERAEQVLDRQRHWVQHVDFGLAKTMASNAGAAYVSSQGTCADLDALDLRAKFRDHVYGCFLEDEAGIRLLDIIGEDNVMVETDYPHSDSTWPNSIDLVKGMIASLSAETQYKLLRGNAERLFQFVPATEPTRDPAG
jgi:predicted TIM-barrel fold metal-dependent hydrolase